jgi:hypothetical protein
LAPTVENEMPGVSAVMLRRNVHQSGLWITLDNGALVAQASWTDVAGRAPQGLVVTNGLGARGGVATRLAGTLLSITSRAEAE